MAFSPRHGWRKDGGLVLIGVLVLALDQATKALAQGYLAPQPREVLGEWVRLTLVKNPGAAFGLFPDKTAFLVLVSLVAVPAILYYHRFLDARWWLARLSPGLLLGGALGNLADRVRLGYVVDFIDVGAGSLRWPTFNVADSAFVIGCLVLIPHLVFQKSHGKPADTRPPDGGGPAPG